MERDLATDMNHVDSSNFRLDGYAVVRLSTDETSDFQSLYERCSDYHELYEGIPTRPTAAAEELIAVPPGKELADKFALGIYAGGVTLVGYLDLVRDFPSAGEWWLGLLMLDPQVRANGLGSRIYQSAARWVAGHGAHTIWLAVLEENAKAERFWRRQGFEEQRRQAHTSETGHPSRVIVMRHPLSGSRA
jgi:GNAT superfamily N-acetyltransferase